MLPHEAFERRQIAGLCLSPGIGAFRRSVAIARNARAIVLSQDRTGPRLQSVYRKMGGEANAPNLCRSIPSKLALFR